VHIITINVEPDCLLQHVPGECSLGFDFVILLLSAMAGKKDEDLQSSVVSEKILFNSNWNYFLGLLICPNVYRRLFLLLLVDGPSLQNRRNFFLRILGEQRRKRGEREGRSAKIIFSRSSPRARLALRACLAFASVRPTYTKK